MIQQSTNLEKYKFLIFLEFLRNPYISDELKGRLIRNTDDSWRWIIVLRDNQISSSCVCNFADLLNITLDNEIEEGIRKKDPKNKSFHINADVQRALNILFRQPKISLIYAIPILEKFEKYDLWWSYYKPIVKSIIECNDNPDDFIEFFINSKKVDFVKAIAEHPNTPEKYLKILSQSSDTEILCKLASNASLSKELLNKLENIEDESILENLSKNPNLPESSIINIIKSNNWSAKNNISERDEISDKVVQILSFDEEDYIRNQIAKRKTLTQDVIHRLARDPNESIRAEIAKRSDLPQLLLDELFKYESEEINQSLAANPIITDEMRNKFTQSKDRKLLGESFANPKLTELQLETLFKEKDKSWIASWMVGRKNLCHEAAVVLSKSNNWETRERVAAIANATNEVLEFLACDENADVRTSVAQNPQCSEKILKEIISRHTDDGDFHLPLWISQSSFSIEILESMLAKLIEVHKETITTYKQVKEANPNGAAIVPRDFRSLKLFYGNPLATERMKTDISSIYSDLGEEDEGQKFVDQMNNGFISLDDSLLIIEEKLSHPNNARFLSGLAASHLLSSEVIDFLIEKLS